MEDGRRMGNAEITNLKERERPSLLSLLGDMVTSGVEQLFDAMLRKANEMVQRYAVVDAESNRSDRSIKAMTLPADVQKLLVDARDTFLLFAVIPMLPLDHMPQRWAG